MTTLECVASSGRHYPGDIVTLFVYAAATTGQRVRIVLPDGVALQEYSVPPPLVGRVPTISKYNDLLEWSVTEESVAWEIEVSLAVLATAAPLTLAMVTQVLNERGDEVLAEAWATVPIEPKSRYLDYLPSIYSRDDFMGRFLMLFESFWNPLDNQIDSLSYYFDPTLTPSRLLGWLGSWLDVNLDAQLPEPRQRRLLQRAARLYRQRGTKIGLETMLELWTDGDATITEHRSENLRLGKSMRLGQGVALGRRNAPHSFTVKVRLETIEDETPPQRHQRIEQMRPIVERLIQAEKPAHTTYTLELV